METIKKMNKDYIAPECRIISMKLDTQTMKYSEIISC
jgi:hypothetical protein